MDDEPFGVTFDEQSRALVVRGEVDELSGPLLRSAIEDASDIFTTDLVVDLSAVTFMPSVAVGVVAMARRTQQENGASLVLRAAEGSVAQRVLTICGLSHELAA